MFSVEITHLGKSEISYFDPSIGSVALKQKVLRLDIEVQNVVFMKGMNAAYEYEGVTDGRIVSDRLTR